MPDPSVRALSGDPIIREALDRFNLCAEWESSWRARFIEDVKFRHGDSDNGYQWPNAIKRARDVDQRPCLTMNVIRQHNLQIVNEGKRRKSEIKIIGLGNGATSESARVIQTIVRHILYQSDAQSAFSVAREFQVDGGLGWWRVVTDYTGPDTFDQDIYILPVNDPLAVYADPDAQQRDLSDMNYALVFDNIPKDQFKKAFPKYEGVVGTEPLGVSTVGDAWITEDHVRVAEYFRRVPKRHKLISFMDEATGQRKTVRDSALPLEVLDAVLSHKLTKWREVFAPVVEWRLIAGEQVIDETDWMGDTIPLVRIIGEETTVGGVLDRKGHTRAMKDAQRMYNYNAPLALDTPIPTPRGWTTMGQVQRGDEVIDEKGQPAKVIGTSPITFAKNCFEVKFDDGSKIIASEDHLWKVEERGKRKSAGWTWIDKTITTKELVPSRHFIKLAKPFDLNEDELLPLHPYLLGVWLGDGTSANASVTAGHDDVRETWTNIAALGYTCGEIHDRGPACNFTVLGIRHKLAGLGVLNDKHIPAQYLRASYSQRLALVQGLMDTDGHVTKNNQCVFINVNKEITLSIIELLKSVGIKSTVSKQKAQAKIFPNGQEYTSQESYRVQLTADPDQQIFRLTRKRTVQEKLREVHWRRTKRFGIESIRKVPSVPVKCLTLDTPEHLFLAGLGMVPTHNSSQVEHVALQSKTPWVTPVKAIEGHESVWNTANTVNHSVLPYNHKDDDASAEEPPIPPPTRQEPPQSSPAYQAGMDTAFNQMMMTSGQWQNQMGMLGNERTGKAIAERQEQSDTAVYHFYDNYAQGLRRTGKIIIELLPRVYDTRRVKRMLADDGVELEVELDPAARLAYFQQLNHQGEVIKRVLNPTIGLYDVAPEVGPAFGSQMQETADALTVILTQAPALTGIIGDLLLASLPFEKAQEAAQRLKRMVPPLALGKGPTQIEQQLQQQVTSLQAALAKVLERQGKDSLKLVGKNEMRDIDVFKAITERAKVMLDHGLAGRELDQQLHEVNLDAILRANESNQGEGGDNPGATPGVSAADLPPAPGAQRAPDGEWYLADPTRQGKYMRVAPLAQERLPRNVIDNG